MNIIASGISTFIVMMIISIPVTISVVNFGQWGAYWTIVFIFTIMIKSLTEISHSNSMYHSYYKYDTFFMIMVEFIAGTLVLTLVQGTIPFIFTYGISTMYDTSHTALMWYGAILSLLILIYVYPYFSEKRIIKLMNDMERTRKLVRLWKLKRKQQYAADAKNTKKAEIERQRRQNW